MSAPHAIVVDRNGKPPQPIPLRLVPLITGWPVPLLLTILSPEFDEHRELLTAYEFAPPRAPAWVRPTCFTELRRAIQPDESFEVQLARLPAGAFVWSDELADAFTAFIDLTIGRESAVAEGMCLVWHPALHDAATLISECPSLTGVSKTLEIGRASCRERV